MNRHDSSLQVLEQVSPKVSEVVRATAIKFSQRNRSQEYLPRECVCNVFLDACDGVSLLTADKWRCCLQKQIPDYIHASFADVSTMHGEFPNAEFTMSTIFV
jgi:hypothetical protein